MIARTLPATAPYGSEPTVRFALPGEGERVIFELRTAHGTVVQTMQPRLVSAMTADPRGTAG